MDSPDRFVVAREGRWTSLWAVALVSLVAQLWLCQFFSLGENVPASIDVNPSNLWKLAYSFPPSGTFQVLNWLGLPYAAQALNPLSLCAARCSTWLFFTAYVPVISTCALLAMTAFLRELDLSRPAALFGAVIYAWQGEILPFIYPGHYGYITSWPFFAVAAWGALRSAQTGHWAYPVISGVSCGMMVGLLTNADRGGIASALIGLLYLASFVRSYIEKSSQTTLRNLCHLALCVTVAVFVALAQLLTLFQNNIAGVKLGGTTNPQETYGLVTQFSLGPAETLTYLTPGLFGWHNNHPDGPYWGWIGEWPGWQANSQLPPNFNLAISTIGTVATGLALLAILLLLPGRVMGPDRMSPRQRFYGRVLLAAGFVALILSWGWHTPFYRPLLSLPLMDKWRDPLKWLEMTNFALIVFSAFGIDHVVSTLGAATTEIAVLRKRLKLFAYAGLTLLLIGLMATYPIATVLASVLANEKFDPGSIAGVMATMHNSVLIALVSAVFACLVVLAAWEPENLRACSLVNPWLNRIWRQMLAAEMMPLTTALALAALAVAQLTWVATHFILPSSLRDLTDINPLTETLREEGDRVRVSVEISDPILNSLLQNQFTALDISCLEISAASRIPDDFNTYRKTLEGDQARFCFLAGVKNIVVPQSELTDMRKDARVADNIADASGYTLAPTGSMNLPSHALVEMKDYMAKATLVPHAEYFAEDKKLLNRLKDAAWNPRDTILLMGKGSSTTPPAPTSNPTDKIDLKIYTTTEIQLTAHSAAGGYVLINDQFDPDWQVQVNGHDAVLLRADYIMRAVPIPPGDSTVEMRYVAHDRVAGLQLNACAVNLFSDGAMLLAWIIAGLALWKNNAATARNRVAISK